VAGPGEADAKSRTAGRFARERLPRGRHRLSVSAVAENQRWRLLGGAADVFYEHGYIGTTSKLIANSAGVSSSAFYRFFDDVSECLHAAFDVAAEAFVHRLAECRPDPADHGRRVRAGVEALLCLRRAEPQLVSLLGPELAAAEPEVAVRRRRLINRLGVLLGEAGGSAPGTAVNELLVAAALTLSCDRPDGRDPGAQDLAGQLPELLERCVR
jgi:AcrR family transcriptional regulator